MTFTWKPAFILALLFLSCDTGKLNLIADIPNHLTEVSAVETLEGSDLFWVIEDGGKGDKNYVYGLDKKGNIKSEIRVLKSKNQDWEDLTTDDFGNLYIGDFGNNSKKRKTFIIYKVSNITDVTDEATAEYIKFTLPKALGSQDFEAFFEYKNAFYIFSKERKKGFVIKVPNTLGNHVAELVTKFELKGKERRITSADISKDGKQVVLLNHDKAWLLSGFKDVDFFGGETTPVVFEHVSQKEGICFKNDHSAIITDERNGASGGNIYTIDF